MRIYGRRMRNQLILESDIWFCLMNSSTSVLSTKLSVVVMLFLSLKSVILFALSLCLRRLCTSTTNSITRLSRKNTPSIEMSIASHTFITSGRLLLIDMQSIIHAKMFLTSRISFQDSFSGYFTVNRFKTLMTPNLWDQNFKLPSKIIVSNIQIK